VAAYSGPENPLPQSSTAAREELAACSTLYMSSANASASDWEGVPSASDAPKPRQSQVMTRASLPSDSMNAASWGHSQMRSIGTRFCGIARSIGPSPNTVNAR
jgi:hypothetical protein